MKNEIIRKAYDSVLPNEEAKARMLWNILAAVSDPRPERIEKPMRKKSIKRGAMLILAAALALALSVTALAYAADLFGFRALKTPEPEGGYEPNPLTENGETRISITQPQDVPDDVYEDVGSEIAEGIDDKLESSRLAWAEWDEVRQGLYANSTPLLKKFDPDYEGWEGGIYTTDNGDGTETWEYEMFVDGKSVIVDTKTFTKQEIEEYHEALDSYNDYDSGYDFNYGIHTDEQKRTLEEIAAKYGLDLRGNFNLMWSTETTGRTGDGFYTNEEVVDIISDTACSGRLFYETPIGFDKVYYYDEGTFCVSWYANVPSGGEKVDCYGYNSVYSTLSSGNEIMAYAEDIDSFASRKHTCTDGTEVTILSNGGEEAYIYVYLENSFFAEHVTRAGAALTDADLDYIADSINYSVIGK